MNNLSEKAREAYQHILDGKKGRWFDSGEFENLKREWFDTFALKLIESLEGYEERESSERDGT